MITADSILRDIETYMADLVRIDHRERTAIACATAVVECLYLNFRHQYIYVPTAARDEAAEKYMAIWREFNGRNHAELSIKYHLCVQRIYQIIERMRQQHIGRVQTDLFGTPEHAEHKPLLLHVMDEYLPAELVRAGLVEDDSVTAAGKIRDYLCETYPGVSFKITDSLWRARQRGDNHDLFAEAI